MGVYISQMCIYKVVYNTLATACVLMCGISITRYLHIYMSPPSDRDLLPPPLTAATTISYYCETQRCRRSIVVFGVMSVAISGSRYLQISPHAP